MYRQLTLACALCLGATSQATEMNKLTDSVRVTRVSTSELMLQPIEPTYLAGVTETSPWKGHWFLSAGAGVNVFAGDPLGCGDMFDRMRPAYTFSVGKWFTPSIGGRIAFSGFQMKDACFEVADYQSIHADFLWNLAPSIYRNTQDPRWEFSPYVGAGIIHNDSQGGHPFALSYGFKSGYRMTKRLHLNLELGGTTTFRDFDGLGDSRKMGDHLFQMTAGLSVTLGKSSWKRVIDAAPYMAQNNWLMDQVALISEQNQKYVKRHDKDSRVIAEMKKILELEGLLETYGNRLKGLEDGSVASTQVYPFNGYSGYNSLMARLRNRKWNGDKDSLDCMNGTSENMAKLERNAGVSNASDYDKATPSDAAMWNDYLIAMSRNRACIGAPIYFFFRLNTAELTDASQSLNIDEIARIAQKYDLRIRITGAADSATGSSSINKELSQSRASFIGQQFLQRGIEENHIVMIGKGGIADFSPKEVNRQTKVELFFEPKKGSE